MRRALTRVFALASKETLHIVRDPRVLFMAIAMPVVLIVLFGYGVRFDMDRVPIAILDHDRSAESRHLREAFVASGELRLARQIDDASQIEPLFRRGDAVGALVIPRGFARAIGRGERAEVQLVVDGSDANTANQTLAKADAIGRWVSLGVTRRAGFEVAPAVAVRTWTRFNPSGRSALYLVPGLAAYILAIVAVLLTALTVAREWESGSMEQLFATPVGRLEIVAGKLLPYLALGAIGVLLVLSVGAWVFDMPLRGSMAFLAVASVLFLIGALGQGLLISVVTRNQMVATQAATLSSMLPSMLLSGVIFPIENMPRALQWVSTLVPARYYVESLRGVLLRGNGASTLWPQAAALAAFAALMIALSALRFKRRLA
ncbi:MAG: ABC transporter permease [Myxococcales bacterium]|nr:ABC transporter permease [Myxococcales bacterium]